MRRPGRWLARSLFLILLAPSLVFAADEVSLGEQIEDIKQQTLQLNRDLFILEEELLFPSNTQMAVYLSMDVGTFFALDAVKLTIDGTVVANYLYTERQVDALQRGGIHRLYMGNVKNGDHEIVAVFTGRGPKGRDYRRATQLQVAKTAGAKNLELLISDSESLQQPEFSVREW
ncbi:AraC family transcriptional regulator [Pseudohalioglobus lutimaris]|uniref:AraC family transcriptional regulator n=1 Tax=Pseudohalioglobus lutimaris TaxID=1737061 RepID=A0A2N5X0Q7_9GAMM|nr:AraC family transcriptional regulator [Pseudohalioglobus lutimaris]PLW68058.1 AraC family transcriptional regulator [Pseudohalioglobus lutimaris]